jgi:hypothetical protein
MCLDRKKTLKKNKNKIIQYTGRPSQFSYKAAKLGLLKQGTLAE